MSYCRVSVSVAAIGISDTLAQVPSALSDKIELAVRLMVYAAAVALAWGASSNVASNWLAAGSVDCNVIEPKSALPGGKVMLDGSVTSMFFSGNVAPTVHLVTLNAPLPLALVARKLNVWPQSFSIKLLGMHSLMQSANTRTGAVFRMFCSCKARGMAIYGLMNRKRGSI